MMKKSRKLSADAKIIIALMKNQPQKIEDLWRSAKVHRGTFYRRIPILDESKIVKKTDEGYALWDYNPLEGEMRKLLERLQKEQWIAVTLDYLGGALRQYPYDEEFQRLAWRLVPEYGLKIGEKIERQERNSTGLKKFRLRTIGLQSVFPPPSEP